MSDVKGSPGPKPYNVKYITDPTQDELREIAMKFCPAIMKTAYGNVNKLTKNKARMAKYTYIIAPESEKNNYSGNIIDPDKAKKLIEIQKRYIEKQGEIVEINGYYGIGDAGRPIQWLYDRECTNVGAMQQILSFPRSYVEPPEKLNKHLSPGFAWL